MSFRIPLFPLFLAAWVIVGIAGPMPFQRAVAQQPVTQQPVAQQPATQQPAPLGSGEKAEASIREQDIYIPYEKLRQVFEKHGRGVFLPYEKFQELWQAAQDKTKTASPVKPPVGAMITETDNEATVEKDVVRVKAKLKIDVLAEGWNELSLRLSDAAITGATLGDQPARILGTPNQDYRLLIEKKGKEPESLTLNLEYAKAITRSPGQNSVSFETPQAPVSRWRVTIPQPGVKVNLHPLIAATEVPADPKAQGDPGKSAAETVVLAFVGAAPTVRIDWTPKAEGATGLAAVASVQTEQQVWVNEGVVRTRAVLNYAISRAELSQLSLDVPAGQKVVNVFDANVRQWAVETVEGQQRITAQLFEPAKATQQVTVELEQFVGEQAERAASVPGIKAVGVGRQQGVIVVQVGEGLRAEVTKTSGLVQIDAAELTPALKQGKWAFSYRYTTMPFELVLGVEKVEPRIQADSLVEASVEPVRLTLNWTTIYHIEKAGVFRLDLDIPAGYEVRDVRGVKRANAEPVQIDSHHLEGDNKTRLVVNLSRKAFGSVGVAVRLEKELHQPELLSPLGKAAEIPFTVPMVAAGSAERMTGQMIVYSPESLRVNPSKMAGLRSISFQEAIGGLPGAASQKATDLRPVLAFAYTQEPASLTLLAERRKPQVTVRQLLVVRVEEGVVKYQIMLLRNVLYSGVKSLRIDVPAEMAGGLRVATPGVREAVIDPPPADVPKGYVAWSLTGESEMLGDGKIELTWENKLEKLDIGKSVTLAVPCIKPAEVDLAWGQIALVKSEMIDVEASGEPRGLRPIDPQHDLIAETPAAARAFEFHDEWSLAIEATRYQLEEVKTTGIERAMVQMVVTPAKEISVQALYRMKSARQRLIVSFPEAARFDTQPLRINGRPVTLEKGQEGKYFVPLVDPSADTAFVLELRYTMPGDGRDLDLPQFPEEPAVVKLYACVYLPNTRVLLGMRGPWTEEFCWRLDTSLRWAPVAQSDADHLAAWVREGVSVAAEQDSFQTDGRLYVYSTLRPLAPPEGSLRLTTVDGRWLRVAVFLATLLLGVLLLPARLPIRMVVIAVAIILLIFAGAFLPTLSLQILNGTLLSAVAIVLLIWAVAFCLRWRGRKAVADAASNSRPACEMAASEPVSATAAELPATDEQEGGCDHV